MNQEKLGVLLGSAVVLMASQPVWAATTEVTAVRLNPTENGIELTLETEAGEKRSPILTVNRDNDLVADIPNTLLRLSEGDRFQQDNPLPGIKSVVVTQKEGNSVQIAVSGQNASPIGKIVRQGDREITLNIRSAPSIDSSLEEIDPPPIASQPSPILKPDTPTQVSQAIPVLPPPVAQAAPAPIAPPPTSRPDVLVPNPQIMIDGQPAPASGTLQPIAPAPPFLPRAVPPPVGDIGVANVDSSATRIDLGTGARVSRLVLQDAPVRDVLALLARTAQLNLAFVGGAAQQVQGGQTPGQTGPTISLDVENEPVQDVFNYVLQLSGLQANRSGNTIFVGAVLPQGAQDLITRSFRMNQVSVAAAAGFLSAQGAETQRVIERVQIQTIGEGAAARTVETRDLTVVPLAATAGTGPLLLRGVSVLTDERLNAITLVGEPRKVQIATNFLTQLDARRRQVALNVKIVDVNLLNTEDFNTSFSFGIGDSFFSVAGGNLNANTGGFNPPTAAQVQGSLAGQPVIANPYAGGTVFLDPNSRITVPGTGVGNRVVVDGNLVQDTSARGSFLAPISGFTSNPTLAGITQRTIGTPNVTTTTTTPAVAGTPSTVIPNGDGTFTVVPGTAGTPATSTTTFAAGTPGSITTALPSLFQFPRRLLASLQAQIQSGNAKILTDPTLVVQEGQRATVNLTQEVFGGTETTFVADAGGNQVPSTRPIIKNAGLILDVTVNRIDDNGFVSVAVQPTVSAIGGSSASPLGTITLLQARTLSTGEVRLRDGQTLILSGIIQESDRTTVSKIPILGDLPLLGALFRSTNRQNQRQEVIVLVTPQILDDSERSNFGYNYTPGRDARQLLQRSQ